MAIADEFRAYVNQYSTQFNMYSTDDKNVNIDFGFQARILRVQNKGGTTLHYSLNSSVATTAHPELLSGDKIKLDIVALSGIGIVSTTTTTSTGGSNEKLVVINAWG